MTPGTRGAGPGRRGAELLCYAVAAPGLEGLVAGELSALGIEGRAGPGGVTWTGDAEALYRANLWLRTATRVVVRMARFRATSFWELERRAAKVPWAEFVAPGDAVAFRVTARKSRLYHSNAIAQRLGESVRAALPDVRVVEAVDDESEDAVSGRPPQLFVARMDHDELTISADSSGEPLYRRGYRQAVARAPLRETLAAAMLLTSGWRPGEPVVDPFCGSGTIPLEAALIAGNVAPGLASAERAPRDYAFRRWASFRAQVFATCVHDAALLARVPSGPFLGMDRDAGAVGAARANALRAGLGDAVQFAQAPVSALDVPPGARGWIVTNPPYGLRIGEQGEVRRLYAAFGRACRERAPGWGVAMLSPDPRLDAISAAESGRRLEERLRTRNGGIPVRVVAG